MAKRHKRLGIAGDDAHLVQADQAKEQADACADAEFQRHRNGVDQPFADAQQADDEEQHAGQEHGAECDLPVHAHAFHHGEGEVGVEPHAWCECERQIRQQSHRGGTDGRGDAGGDERGALVDPCLRQDRGIYHDDVGHRQVGGETCQQFRADRCPLSAQIEHW